MRLSDLRDKMVRSLDGEPVGRVHEVHCDKGKIVALMCGPASLIERWTGKRRGRRIEWSSVVKVGRKAVIVGPEKPIASQSRQGTRRPSAPSSKR